MNHQEFGPLGLYRRPDGNGLALWWETKSILVFLTQPSQSPSLYLVRTHSQPSLACHGWTEELENSCPDVEQLQTSGQEILQMGLLTKHIRGLRSP